MVPSDDDKISEGQHVNFLEAAISGVHGLNHVRAAWNAAQKGAGRAGAKLSPTEYTESLLAQAAVIDAPKSRTNNPRYRANVSEYLFEDDDDAEAIEADHTGTYDVSNHEFDVDSTAEYMISLTERNGGRSGFKKKAWMDKQSWQSLSQDDKDTWDKLSDSAKATIRNAHQKKPDMNQRRPNPPRKTFANAHEQEAEEPKASSDVNPGTNLQASAHEIAPPIEANKFEYKPKDTTPEPQVEPMNKDQDILSFMAQKARSRDATKTIAEIGDSGLSINSIMSTIFRQEGGQGPRSPLRTTTQGRFP